MPPLTVSSHTSFMREALRLARPEGVLPYPNPWVGCIIVNQGKIVGRGFHCGPGTNHAEVEALTQARDRARNATLYSTLEPCCHYGQTPPCANAILAAGIQQVIYAFRDPNPAVSGQGAKFLRAHGLVVKSGVCRREAMALNEVYLKYRATGIPFVTAKVATSLDGKIATRTGESKWITDPTARRRGRSLRSEHQAILVGIDTVLADDPHLGPRKAGAPEPWRVVLDSRLRISTRSKVIQSGKCIVACTSHASPRHITRLERCGATVWMFEGKRIPLQPLLSRLATKEIISVLVEGGSEVLGNFFDQRLVDRVHWFLAPLIIGSLQSRPAIAGKGVAKLAHAWRFRKTYLEPVGKSWMFRGNLSRWAIS